jgi:hypothetical protein
MMRLLFSMPMALLGSLLGSALRAGLKVAEARLDAEPGAPAAETTLNVNGSVLAALGGGLMGILFGTRTAFWTGVALGAAGTDRFDARLLRMAGVDVDAMVARARSMAEQAGRRASAAATEAGEAGPENSGATSTRKTDTAEIPIESPTAETA